MRTLRSRKHSARLTKPNESIRQLFTGARTHHGWQDKPVDDGLLHDIYDLTKWGPTSANCSPMRMVFVKSQSAKEKLLPALSAHRGRDEIDRVAGAIKATHPDFQYQPIAEPEELGNGGRVQWVSGRPGEAPAYAGTDFIIARDGRIAAVYLFFDMVP